MRSSLTRRACAAALLLTSVLTPAAAGAATPSTDSAGPSARKTHARLLGEKIVPFKLDFQGTTVGGLSGIDRDPCTGEYVFLSDDRGYNEPARYYTATLDVDAGGVHAVDFTGTHNLLQPDGSVYPSPALGDGKAVDPEEIRVDPRTCDYWWGQEGDRPKTAGPPVIQPSIQFAAPDTGAYVGQLRLPENYLVTADRGPRRNQAIEALTFDARGRVLTSAIEGPLLQDGPEPTTEHGALVRVTQQARDGAVLGQFAYPLEKLFAVNDPNSSWGPDTGVPSILAFPHDPERYLVLERTWVAGAGYKVRLFEATTRGATDVKGLDSLATDGETVKPMRKKLVADFHDLGLSTVDNTEGMTWGPDLGRGERALILVSDDNFVEDAVTQIVALAVR